MIPRLENDQLTTHRYEPCPGKGCSFRVLGLFCTAGRSCHRFGCGRRGDDPVHFELRLPEEEQTRVFWGDAHATDPVTPRPHEQGTLALWDVLWATQAEVAQHDHQPWAEALSARLQWTLRRYAAGMPPPTLLKPWTSPGDLTPTDDTFGVLDVAAGFPMINGWTQDAVGEGTRWPVFKTPVTSEPNTWTPVMPNDEVRAGQDLKVPPASAVTYTELAHIEEKSFAVLRYLLARHGGVSETAERLTLEHGAVRIRVQPRVRTDVTREPRLLTVGVQPRGFAALRRLLVVEGVVAPEATALELHHGHVSLCVVAAALGEAQGPEIAPSVTPPADPVFVQMRMEPASFTVLKDLLVSLGLVMPGQVVVGIQHGHVKLLLTPGEPGSAPAVVSEHTVTRG